MQNRAVIDELWEAGRNNLPTNVPAFCLFVENVETNFLKGRLEIPFSSSLSSPLAPSALTDVS